MKKTDIKANAKINLFLEITGRRENGYHDISTVMHSVRLCDNVTVANNSSNTINITSNSDTMPTDRRNIAYKCTEAFLCELNISDGIDIYIEKNIPMEAGLAGGSADGAAVLNGLNELYSFPFSKDKLCSIGEKIGADIPFCIMGGAMLCEGIGEIMTPCSTLPDCHIVIAKGNVGVSTKDAYNKLDTMENRIIHNNNMPELLYKGDLKEICDGMFNCFEQLVPGIENIKNIMLRHGSLGSMMSGSGSAVFGIFAQRSDADKALDELKRNNYFACIC